MMRKACILCVCSLVMFGNATAIDIDTLRSTAEIEDAVIYSYGGCVAEVDGEDCRRYNAGGIPNNFAGNSGPGLERRTVMRFPGWDGTVPDSATLKLYCWYEYDSMDRRIIAYPLVRRIFEGNEGMYNAGDYPDPDSGVTWQHVWLDVGDADSLSWAFPGGDFALTVTCTMTVAGTGSYAEMPRFERLLRWFDSTGFDPAVVLINENAAPAASSAKVFKSSETGSGYLPMLLLYHGTDEPTLRRRRAINQMLN